LNPSAPTFFINDNGAAPIPSRKIKRIFQTSVIESQNLRPKFIAPLTPQSRPYAILNLRSDGTPHDENDSEVKAREEEQRRRPKHDLCPIDLAIVTSASIDLTADPATLHPAHFLTSA
jgi:hypothetical protein